MKITSLVDYSEFKALLGEAKRQSDPLFARFVYRPLSFPTGWFFYKIGMKANSVSLLSIFLAITSSLIMVFGDSDDIVVASFLMILVALSDCIDGNVARARGETGPSGEWMDALSGYTVYALLPFALGIHIFLHNPHEALPGLWIILGALTSIANLFLRLLYQKFLSSMIDESTQKGLKGSGSLFSRFSSEMGLIGWMMPALLVASITNKLGIYLGFYCFFYVISAVIITIVLARKVT
jgi:phosphatidylglycerophosphate synthase